MRRLVTIVVLFSIPSVAWGQFGGEGAVNLMVDTRTEGTISQTLAHEVREEVRSSDGFYLSSNEPIMIGLHFRAIDIGNTNAAAYSVAFTLEISQDSYQDSYFYYNTIGTAPQNELKQTARTIIAEADEFRARLQRAVDKWEGKLPSGN